MSIFTKSSEIIPSFTGNPATGAGIAVPALATWYGRPWSTSIDATAFNVPLIKGGTLSNLVIRTSNAQPGDGTCVITLQVNAIATLLVVTIPAGGAGGTYTNQIDAVSIPPFEIVRWQIVNNSPTLPSAAITGIYMLLS